jgi:SAM-dependent methyltransferase
MESVAREIGKIPVANGRFLDFGCGKDAVLTDILRRGGHECTPYDPLYNYPLPAGADSYDCIVLCEVIEHLRDLRCEAALIRSLLAPQGYLFIRTELCSQRSDFNAWWYAQDCTHINFFTPSALETFGSLAGRDRWYTDEVRIAIFR